MSSLLRLGLYTNLAVVTVSALQKPSLFSLHPIAMWVSPCLTLLISYVRSAFLVFVGEAVVVLDKKKAAKESDGKPKVSRSEQIDAHAGLALASVSTAALGVTVAYYVKSQGPELDHLGTTHGILGASVLAFAFLQGLGGMLGRTAKKSMTPHRVMGHLLFIGAIVTASLHEAVGIGRTWMGGNEIVKGVTWPIALAALATAAVGLVSRKLS